MCNLPNQIYLHQTFEEILSFKTIKEKFQRTQKELHKSKQWLIGQQKMPQRPISAL